MPEVAQTLLDFAQNVSLLALILVGYAAIRRYAALFGNAGDISIGTLFGFGAVMAMATTIVLPSGILIDGRNILICLAPIFGGWVGGMIALLIGSLYRLWLGGPSTLQGVVGIAIAAAVGFGLLEIYRRTGRKKATQDFLILGLIVAVESVARTLAFRGSEPEALAVVVATLGVVPLGTVILGVALHHVDDRLDLERKLKAETARANEASQAKSWFLASMAHELRTPLNGILGFSEIVRDQTFGTQDHARYAEYGGHIHRSGQHLLALINDILDLSKIEAGKMELSIVPIEAASLANSAIALMGGLAEARGVQLKSEVDPACALVHLDLRAAKQMLLNLLSNAVKFTPSGGSVALKIGRAADGRVKIDVLDTGIGMSPEESKLAVEIYGQIHQRLSSDSTGTGLGLPLVKAFAELHGGSMQIVSSRGDGTTVSLYLPDLAVAA
jgi:signal transduction histidine kinase